jgi:MFS transporter, SET family, sugar efflux transporter
MQFRRFAELAAAPFFLPIAAAILFIGLGDAVAGSYLTLFAVNQAHFSPLALGIFLTVLALSGIIISTVFGYWLDRAPSLVPLFLALLMTVVGYALLTVTNRFLLLLLIAALPLGTSAAAFPQLFALAKGHLDQVGEQTAERGTAMMRATWSVAWAVGPALGALVITFFDFRGVFLAASVCAVLASAMIGLARVRATRRTMPTDANPALGLPTIRETGFAASSLTLFHMAMFMGSIALPIVATQNLGGTNGDVGLIFSVCAFLEVLVMLAFVLRPSISGTRRWLSTGFLAFGLYFLVINWAPSVAVLLLAQVLRAIGIGLVGYHGISYIQVLMPDRVGSAATLFSNTTNAGFLLAGLAAGGWAQLFGYRSMFLACAVLSGLGLLMLYLQIKLKNGRSRQDARMGKISRQDAKIK